MVRKELFIFISLVLVLSPTGSVLAAEVVSPGDGALDVAVDEQLSWQP